MRNDQEFLAEIYSREEKYIKRKKKMQKAALLSVIPLFVCTAVVLGITIAPNFVSHKNSAPTADRETNLYTGDYEEITDDVDDAEGEVAVDTAVGETDNGTAEIITSQSQQEYVDESFDGALEKPTESINSDEKSQDNLSVNSVCGMPLQGQFTEDSATSQAPDTANKSEAVSSEATKQDSVANNNGLLKEPEWFKEYKKKWKTLIDADSFTFIYKSRKICVNNETAVDKMKTIIADPYHKVVDFSDDSPEILTIEMGGMKFILKSQTLQNVTFDESYKLSELFMKAFKFVLAENHLLSDDLAKELDVIINSFDDTE